MVEVWRSGGRRNPLDLLIAQEAREAKKTRGCFACSKRPKVSGGEGSCKTNRLKPGCGFTHDDGGRV